VGTGDIERWKIESPPLDEEWIQIGKSTSAMVSVVAAKPDTYYNGFFSGRRGYVGPQRLFRSVAAKILHRLQQSER